MGMWLCWVIRMVSELVSSIGPSAKGLTKDLAKGLTKGLAKDLVRTRAAETGAWIYRDPFLKDTAQWSCSQGVDKICKFSI